MQQWFLLVPVLLPLAGALVLQGKAIKGCRARVRLVTGLTVLLTAACGVAVLFLGDCELLVGKLTATLPIYFRVDTLSRYFAAFTILMWVCSTCFSFEYMNHSKEEGRYQTFAVLSFGVLLGICFSGNLITTYLLYELMTLATFPLVLHDRTKEAIAAGYQYLYYSIAGAFLGLLGIFFLYVNAPADAVSKGGSLAYVAGGFLDPAKLPTGKPVLLVFLFLMLVGFGSKIGMFPLHGWLTKAHPVAPAPASALLSGNITKMGMLFLIRVIYYAAGPSFLRGTWVQYALLTLALITVFLGSMLAYKERIFKKRLAYSTVSQTSYSLCGLFLMHPVAIVGALMHVLYHSVIKNLLFLCAGSVIYKTGKTRVEELKGIGKTMPVTMGCFTVAGLALVGIPPMSAFLSKWYLAMGALESNLPVYRYLVPVVLLVSALLTAGYLLTVTADAFFVAKPEEGAEQDGAGQKKQEPGPWMLVPLLALALLALFLGLFPSPVIDCLTELVSTLC